MHRGLRSVCCLSFIQQHQVGTAGEYNISQKYMKVAIKRVGVMCGWETNASTCEPDRRCWRRCCRWWWWENGGDNVFWHYVPVLVWIFGYQKSASVFSRYDFTWEDVCSLCVCAHRSVNTGTENNPKNGPTPIPSPVWICITPKTLIRICSLKFETLQPWSHPPCMRLAMHTKTFKIGFRVQKLIYVSEFIFPPNVFFRFCRWKPFQVSPFFLLSFSRALF